MVKLHAPPAAVGVAVRGEQPRPGNRANPRPMAAPPSVYRRKSGGRITPYLCVRGIKGDGSATEADKLRREKRAGRVLDNGKRSEKSPPRNRGENSL
ncbi:MAG TPA: hypothetical protein VKE91_03645, partial [Blastocatellia bacterium]|nr:hypothetical protein [Blastocatellia bacterium]